MPRTINWIHEKIIKYVTERTFVIKIYFYVLHDIKPFFKAEILNFCFLIKNQE